MKYIGLLLALVGFINSALATKTIYFKAKDGVEVAADLYLTHPISAPFIILFHQANWSRGEYKEIAPRLNNMGYNCMAVDLRSGGSINDVNNITKQNAIKGMKETNYVNALPDMEAAIKHAKDNFVEGKLIVWGSSYSAALSIKLAGDTLKPIDAVLAFSPGEYFASQGKPRDYVTSGAININKPIFITSAKGEKNAWWGIYVAIPAERKTYYLPETMGNHGSKALWSKFSDAEDYWKEVDRFLSSI